MYMRYLYVRYLYVRDLYVRDLHVQRQGGANAVRLGRVDDVLALGAGWPVVLVAHHLYT